MRWWHASSKQDARTHTHTHEHTHTQRHKKYMEKYSQAHDWKRIRRGTKEKEIGGERERDTFF